MDRSETERPGREPDVILVVSKIWGVGKGGLFTKMAQLEGQCVARE